MSRLLNIIAWSFLLLAATLSNALADNPCQTIEVSDNFVLAMPVAAEPAWKTTEALLATSKKYPFTANICIILKNSTAATATVTIRLDNPRISHAELVNRNESTPTVMVVAGIDYPLDQWQTYSAEVMFTTSLLPETTQALQLNIASKAAYNSQLQIGSSSKILDSLTRQQLITGLLTGIILSLVFYSVFLAITSKEKIYYFLCGSTAGVTLLQLGDLGTLYSLWPRAIYWNNISPTVFAISSAICGVGLARHYLITSIHTPRSDKCLKLYCWHSGLVALPFSFLENFDFNVLLFAIPTVIMMIGLVILSIIRIRQNYTPAKLYLVALTLPVIAGMGIAANYMGILPSSPMTRLIPLTGTAIQLILFALALGEQINWLNEEQKKTALQTLLVNTETSAKKNFQAHISHELRTPIAGIIGLTALARKNSLYEQNKSLIDGIDTSARHLLYTTNMLLDHARIDAGKWALEQKNFSIRKLLEKIIEKNFENAEHKNLRLSSNTDLDIPEIIFGYSDIIERVLDSLIDNAIKFTEEGGIHIMAESVASDKTDFNLRIKVMDTGKGIAPDFKEKIFEVLEQADPSTTRIHQGPGLGLSLSKKFCELAGGDIGFESTTSSENQSSSKGTRNIETMSASGTTFWCEFPCQLQENSKYGNVSPQTGTPGNTASQATLAGKRVLAAEDDEALMLILESHLKNLNIPHALFPNGKLLVEEYKVCHEDVGTLLLDWNMPIYNASQTIIAIREFERNHCLPPVRMVVISAYDRNSAKEMNLPADITLLHKPLSISELRSTLSQSDLI